MFRLLTPLVDGIAATFGRSCEVVLHDLQDPTNSIVAIRGEITGRRVGGSVTEIGLSLVAQGDAAEDQFNYITRASGERVFKSSTMLLRDPKGHVFGALCINIDTTEIRRAEVTLREFAGVASGEPKSIAFVDDIGEVMRAAIEEEDRALPPSLDRSSRAYRSAIVRRLDNRGMLAFQRAIPLIAQCLGISRATAYSYLEKTRAADEDRRRRLKGDLPS